MGSSEPPSFQLALSQEQQPVSNDWKALDAIVRIINVMQTTAAGLPLMLAKRLLIPHALLLNNFRPDATADAPLKAKAVLTETENIIFNLMVDMGVNSNS